MSVFDLATASRRQTLLGMADGCYQALSNDPQVITMLAHRSGWPQIFPLIIAQDFAA